ncbi:hypothetical protein A2U01_0010119, partial [Trifolium medium]|nr:hypothetical protein [Trifolium medium]
TTTIQEGRWREKWQVATRRTVLHREMMMVLPLRIVTTM